MKKIIDTMRLATECIVISLIYLEKLMLTSKVEIRLCNWRPMVFIAILLASKFWDDISFWNIDFVEALEIFALKQVNRLESEFLSLCAYNIFVSAECYLMYRNEIRQMTVPSTSHLRNNESDKETKHKDNRNREAIFTLQSSSS